MKRIKIAVIVFLIGSIIAFVTYQNDEKSTYTRTIAFQLGVFKDENNAIRLKERLGGIVIKDADVYRVYYAILHDKDNIKFIENNLKEKEVSYYIRNVNLNETIFLKGDKYETLMNKTMKDNNKLKVNNKMLNFYKEALNVY